MPPMDVWQGDRIAFLGGGHMASALIAGLLRQGMPAAQISVGEPREALRVSLAQEYGVLASPDNRAAVAGATLVVLAVKPQDAASALQGLQALRDPQAPAQPRTLLSIVAGLTVASLARSCPADLAIVRAMPNRPALLGAGMTGLYAPPATPPASRAAAERIARAAGQVVWLHAESELDLVTALSGSGPAYFFLLAEHLASAGVALGLSRRTADLLAAETLYGAGLLAHRVAEDAREHPARAESLHTLAGERTAVTSRGGTTEAALRVLADASFDALVMRALQAAAHRSAELAAAGSAAPAR
jgi:pyrroline-5-carboxylate reductase